MPSRGQLGPAPASLRLRLWLAACALVVIVVPGAAAERVKESRYAAKAGLTSHTSHLSERDGLRMLQRARAIGVSWFREDLSWAWLEPRRGEYRWQQADRLLRNISKVHGNLLVHTGYAPGWANGGLSEKHPPLNPADYRRFLLAFLHRYGDGGTFWRGNRRLKPRPVRVIELWNEPWLHTFWKPEPDVARYAALVKAVAPAIKARHPKVKILVSGDLHLVYSDGRDLTGGKRNDWEVGWLATLLGKGLPAAAFDGWSIHPYSDRRGPYEDVIPGFTDQRLAPQWGFAKLRLVRELTVAAGYGKPIWNTEWGWSTSGDVDEHTQARYVREGLVRAVDEWGSFVARNFLYVLERPRNHDHAGGYNLWRDDGSPKAAWHALAEQLRRR